MTHVLKHLNARHLPTAFAATVLVLALIYLATKSIFSSEQEIDFRYLWTAGQMWAEGGDPYSSSYFDRGAELFPKGIIIAYWYYPPQWWAICRLLVALPFEQSLLIWRTLNACLAIGSMAFLTRSFSRTITPIPTWAALLLIALPAAMASTAQVLSMGQTTIIIFAGYCFFAAGVLSSRAVPLVIGLILLMLKPQFGIPAAAAAIVMPRYWVPLIVAGAISLAAALPQLFDHGLIATLQGMARNAATYGDYGQNGPLNMSGLNHIVVQTTGHALPGVAMSFIAATVVAAWTFTLSRKSWNEKSRKVAIAMAAIAASIFLIPLHNYDFVVIAPCAVLAMGLRPLPRTVSLLGVIIALRAPFLLGLLGVPRSIEPLLLTVSASLQILAAALAVLVLPVPVNPEDRNSISVR